MVYIHLYKLIKKKLVKKGNPFEIFGYNINKK